MEGKFRENALKISRDLSEHVSIHVSILLFLLTLLLSGIKLRAAFVVGRNHFQRSDWGHVQ